MKKNEIILWDVYISKPLSISFKWSSGVSCRLRKDLYFTVADVVVKYIDTLNSAVEANRNEPYPKEKMEQNAESFVIR